MRTSYRIQIAADAWRGLGSLRRGVFAAIYRDLQRLADGLATTPLEPLGPTHPPGLNREYAILERTIVTYQVDPNAKTVTLLAVADVSLVSA
jgi:hypothetical protein